MTEAGWTREIGESGWYWWRLDDGQLQIVYVSMGGTVSIFGVGKRSLKRLAGEFKGPITPDTYQQGRVAGARDYRDTIIKELDLDNSKQQEFTRTDVILALAHADDALAQQAQDEKGVGDA